ncbi:MAG: tRNA threonylcarbamoyladenosine dehydratase [Desulfobacteraceae bacterium]
MKKAFARTEQLIGKEGLQVLQNARVAVFGLGAVGSFAVEALARLGVGYLRIVDFDTVNATNINRQLYALHSTLDEKKTEVAARRIHDINPDCDIDVQDVFVNADTVEKLLGGRLDAVVDAIDGLNSKVNLICGAVERELAVVSSMGAAGRTDPSMIRTGDISGTCVCPLARFVRRRLRRRGVQEGVSCVYSEEKPRNKTEYDPEDAEHADSGRNRPPIGTVSYIPGIFGLTAAGLVTEVLLQKRTV